MPCVSVNSKILLNSNGEFSFAKNVSIGMQVFAFADNHAGKLQIVRDHRLHEVSTVMRINKSFTCTPDHPVLIENAGWRTVGELKIGDRLVKLNGIEQVRTLDSLSGTHYVCQIDIEEPFVADHFVTIAKEALTYRKAIAQIQPMVATMK